jgi:hypothetical protein
MIMVVIGILIVLQINNREATFKELLQMQQTMQSLIENISTSLNEISTMALTHCFYVSH